MGFSLAQGDAVSIVYAGLAAPVLARGSVVAVDGDVVCIAVRDAGVVSGRIPPGVRAIVEVHTPLERPHLILRVDGWQDGAIVGRTVRWSAPDKRVYPRCFGAVPTRWTDAVDDVDAWLAGERSAARTFEPDPFMSFSVVGLAFEDKVIPPEGIEIFVEFQVPPDLRPHRAVCRVVRVLPIPLDELDVEQGTTHRVAIAFDRIDDDAVEALARYTIRIQDAFLEGLP